MQVSEFMYVVPNFPHLRNIEMDVRYQELRVLGHPLGPGRWNHDPNLALNQNWAPQPQHFLNGVEFRQESVPTSRLLREPPPRDRYPRREGITRVLPGDPDYEAECLKHRRYDLIPGYQVSPVSSTNPLQGESNHLLERINGITPPRSDTSRSLNGGSPPIAFASERAFPSELPNGVGEHDSP